MINKEKDRLKRRTGRNTEKKTDRQSYRQAVGQTGIRVCYSNIIIAIRICRWNQEWLTALTCALYAYEYHTIYRPTLVMMNNR